ncbi:MULTISPECIES: hypothetical protein [unclassified Sphingomonas]|jgi:hypothetical protein|uniref:hypothetical protein n=1 Tax=unclassified Sphingomonas TaxID=196159 RepID=UPI0006210482|nr:MULTISPECIES: hypothetical protein [unclassified Sphingomonas]KKI20879.1 hypothetical protein XM50_04170 [Sphingomonas sp. Ag1]MDF2603902.1 hypothetical protein [Sphingomonas sp.]
MKLNTDQDQVAPSPPPATMPVVFEAIVKQQALAATYNRGDVTLAPHIVYTKHGEFYLDAVTLERDGKPPREPKIGAFKIVGLGGMRVTPRRFTPSELFNPKEERYEGVTLLAVDG